MPRVKHCIRLVLVFLLISVVSVSTAAAQESNLPPDFELHKLEARKRFEEAKMEQAKFIRKKEEKKEERKRKIDAASAMAVGVGLIVLLVSVIALVASTDLDEEDD